MTWLVTGGAGYIGAHVVRALRDAGLAPVVLDALSSGDAAFVPEGVPFVRASLLDAEAVAAALTDHDVTGVIHVAGFKYAGVSVQRPLHTYEQNVTGMITLLESMQRAGVEQCVFSSSAAVYGAVDVDLVTETTAKNPTSPYGESKLIGEWLLRDQEIAAGLRHTSLRYFNVVGSGPPTTWARGTASPCARSWMPWRASPASPSNLSWPSGAPATRRASWRAASSLRATSAGRCATRSPRWSTQRGRRGGHPPRSVRCPQKVGHPSMTHGR